MTVLCSYCGKNAALVNGRVVYPHRPDLVSKKFWHCAPCGAWVGCHPNTSKALGRLAKTELRVAKTQAHRWFDPLWKGGKMNRQEAYRWMRETLQLEPHEAHVGEMDVERCERLIEACREWHRQNPTPYARRLGLIGKPNLTAATRSSVN